MKKTVKSILLGAVLALLAVMPAFAGEWVKGVDENFPEAWSYLNDIGTAWFQDNYVFEGGEGLDTVGYYISPCGTMVTNNYAPNGVWIGEDGKLQYQNGYRITQQFPRAAVYEWTDGSSYVTYSFYYDDDYDDGYSIANVTGYYRVSGTENGESFNFRLVDLTNGCYALYFPDSSEYLFYLSISDDGNSLYVTDMGGSTLVFTFKEALYYS